MALNLSLAPHEQGTILSVKAQPGAKRDAVLGVRQGALRVAVSAAPEKGKANAAVAATLAESIGWPKSRILLLSGETSRDKRLLVVGLAPDELQARLAAALPASSLE